MSALQIDDTTVGVTDAEFRAAMGRFASGVTVITAHDPRGGGLDRGATVSAFSSVTNDPPSILVCLNTTSDTGATVRERRTFVVNVLSRRQERVALHFAGKGDEKFADLEVARSAEGHPVLPGNHVTLECTVSDVVRAGTHDVVIAGVDRIHLGTGTSPLSYHAGAFGRFHAAPRSHGVIRGDFDSHHFDLW